MLTDEQITKFQTLYKNRFGKEISKEEALEKGVRLVRLIELVSKEIFKKDYEKHPKKIQ